MLRFLFGTKTTTPVKSETQRETFDRLVSELNEAIDALPVKPKVTFDPASGQIAFETPEQFPDEALALPAPGKDEDTVSDETDANDAADNVAVEKEKAA
ncbi:hypothetical protein [Shimia ponticola]|uniref:hypothetical protein n=1 Tax=Shimia ponticola TaxID=2582893 RepID=UPI0011BE6ED1|nr:hypothetical protein [Shimia ponticola]